MLLENSSNNENDFPDSVFGNPSQRLSLDWWIKVLVDWQVHEEQIIVSILYYISKNWEWLILISIKVILKNSNNVELAC